MLSISLVCKGTQSHLAFTFPRLAETQYSPQSNSGSCVPPPCENPDVPHINMHKPGLVSVLQVFETPSAEVCSVHPWLLPWAKDLLPELWSVTMVFVSSLSNAIITLNSSWQTRHQVRKVWDLWQYIFPLCWGINNRGACTAGWLCSFF